MGQPVLVNCAISGLPEAFLTAFQVGGVVVLETLEPPGTSEKLNADVAAMVKEISVLGPRIPEIARRLGRHKETVRYWYKKLEEHGFAVQAMVNHEALGLKRLIFKVQFGEGYGDFVKQLMLAMNELAYIVSYAKTLAEDTYIVNASVPTEIVPEYVSFMEALRDQGIFKSIESFAFDWVRNIPMDGAFYDFESGNWEFDVGTVTARSTAFVEPTASRKIKFDRIDLLVAKELQADAARETQEIQRAIKERDNVDINYKTLCWPLDRTRQSKWGREGLQDQLDGNQVGPGNREGKTPISQLHYLRCVGEEPYSRREAHVDARLQPPPADVGRGRGRRLLRRVGNSKRDDPGRTPISPSVLLTR